VKVVSERLGHANVAFSMNVYQHVLADGGEEGQCGWLKDKFGLSWQVCANAAMYELLDDPDRTRADRAMRAMFEMTKLDLAALRPAADADRPG